MTIFSKPRKQRCLQFSRRLKFKKLNNRFIILKGIMRQAKSSFFPAKHAKTQFKLAIFSFLA